MIVLPTVECGSCSRLKTISLLVRFIIKRFMSSNVKHPTALANYVRLCLNDYDRFHICVTFFQSFLFDEPKYIDCSSNISFKDAAERKGIVRTAQGIASNRPLGHLFLTAMSISNVPHLQLN